MEDGPTWSASKVNGSSTVWRPCDAHRHHRRSRGHCQDSRSFGLAHHSPTPCASAGRPSRSDGLSPPETRFPSLPFGSIPGQPTSLMLRPLIGLIDIPRPLRYVSDYPKIAVKILIPRLLFGLFCDPLKRIRPLKRNTFPKSGIMVDKNESKGNGKTC